MAMSGFLLPTATDEDDCCFPLAAPVNQMMPADNDSYFWSSGDAAYDSYDRGGKEEEHSSLDGLLSSLHWLLHDVEDEQQQQAEQLHVATAACIASRAGLATPGEFSFCYASHAPYKQSGSSISSDYSDGTASICTVEALSQKDPAMFQPDDFPNSPPLATSSVWSLSDRAYFMQEDHGMHQQPEKQVACSAMGRHSPSVCEGFLAPLVGDERASHLVPKICNLLSAGDHPLGHKPRGHVAPPRSIGSTLGPSPWPLSASRSLPAAHKTRWPESRTANLQVNDYEAPGPIPIREGTTELQVHGSDISCCCNFCYSVHSTAYGHVLKNARGGVSPTFSVLHPSQTHHVDRSKAPIMSSRIPEASVCTARCSERVRGHSRNVPRSATFQAARLSGNQSQPTLLQTVVHGLSDQSHTKPSPCAVPQQKYSAVGAFLKPLPGKVNVYQWLESNNM